MYGYSVTWEGEYSIRTRPCAFANDTLTTVWTKYTDSPCQPDVVAYGIMEPSYVYIMASGRNGTLYVGVTTDLVKRVYQHKAGLIEGFTKRYQVHLLVYCEVHSSILEAITREKQIKHWKRDWKIELIEDTNPDWTDLYGTII